jgi:hypothetical protein
LSLNEYLSQTNTSCVPKFCYQFVLLLPLILPGQERHC